MSNRALVALVDDDVHSARLLLRSLAEQGIADARWLGDAARSQRLLSQMFDAGYDQLPGLVIVDVKSHSAATLEFVAGISALAGAADILIVALVPLLDKSVRETLLNAGAAAVFERHADIDAYRDEAAGIARYWARSARLEATGS